MFTQYRPNHGYDEYFSSVDQPRASLRPLLSSLGQMGLAQLNQNHAAAAMLLKRLGATFRLNDSGSKGVERILPFDPLPRLIGAAEWQRLEKVGKPPAAAHTTLLQLVTHDKTNHVYIKHLGFKLYITSLICSLNMCFTHSQKNI